MNSDIIADKEMLDMVNLQKRFPEECKRLPFEYLEEDEKIIVNKCMEHEKLTSEELKQLKQLLADYRPFMKRYDSEKIIQNVEKNMKVITTSDELLRLLDDDTRHRIDMKYRVGDKTVLLKLKIKQLPDSDYINLLDAQTRIFKELNDSEKRVYAKAANKQQLTSEEMKMQKHIQDKINEINFNFEGNAKNFTEVISKIVDFVDDPEKTYEEKLSFWYKIDLSYRILLFNEIQKKLNIPETLEDDLFPPVG